MPSLIFLTKLTLATLPSNCIERQPHNPDGLALTRMSISGMNGMTKQKANSQEGTSPELRCATGFLDVHDPNASLLSVIQTGAIHVMPYARFGGADFSVRSHQLSISLSRFDAQMSFTMEGSRMVFFTLGVGSPIDVRIRSDSHT